MTSLDRAYEEIDLFAESRMNEVNMPGLTIAVTDREKLLRLATFGYADLASKDPIVSGTMFEIGSIGKSFTNVALMQVYDEGRLDLHAPVSRYLQWFEVQSDYEAITTHHLMTHTSGLVSGNDIGTHGLYESWALRHSRTATPPGEYFRYSNVGYKTLGFLLEELDGRPYAEAVRARVLDPLEMRDSHPVIGFDSRRRAAVGYRNFFDDRPEHRNHGLVPSLWTEYGVGDGCQASTTNDMCSYLRMLMNGGAGPTGRVVSEISFRLMTQKAVATQQWGGAHYGYGLTQAEIDGHTYLGHGGSTTGFMSAIVADLEEGLGVVVLINGNVESYGAMNMAMRILAILRSGVGKLESSLQLPSIDPEVVEDAQDYAGTYRSGDDNLVLTPEDGRLTIQMRGVKATLEPRGEGSFYVSHPDLEHFLLEVGRQEGRGVELFHGPDWYVSDEYSGPASFECPSEWQSYVGHYRTYNFVLTNFRVVLRKGSLLLMYPTGGHEPLVPLEDGLFRIGEDPRSPETIRFDALASGTALRATLSGCPYYRTYTP